MPNHFSSSKKRFSNKGKGYNCKIFWISQEFYKDYIFKKKEIKKNITKDKLLEKFKNNLEILLWTKRSYEYSTHRTVP